MTALDLPDDASLAASDAGRAEIRAGLLALLAFFVGFGGWAAFAPLDAAVVATGVVVVSGNRQTVQHREGGVVASLLVREGQQVRSGDLLIELSAPETAARERALLTQVLDLQVQLARLSAEMAGATAVTPPPGWAALPAEDRALADAALARHAAAGGAWSQYDARISGYRQEIASLARQDALLVEELEGMEALAAEQLAPLTRVRALERARAELQGRRAELVATIAAAQQERAQESRRIEARLAELNPQWRAARQLAEQTRLRAPVDGAVVGLSVHTVGGVVRPGERVMEIVPARQQLLIEAQLRPEDADDVFVGQAADVRITAFSGRSLPSVAGAVQQVSADRFTDERTGSAYFLAQVAVPREELTRVAPNAGGATRLRPGLPAQVVLRTRKRTALQYLTEPLGQTFWRAFREE